MDNYNIKVQATVDMPKTSDVDGQIKKLEQSISKLKISATIDDTALKNLEKQLNTLKANITSATFSPAALNELTSQINNALKGVSLSGIGNGNQGQQIGQKIGKQVSDGISKGINNNSQILGNFKSSLLNIGMDTKMVDEIAERISKLGVKIQQLNQSSSIGKNGKEILSVNISGIDELGQAIKLTQQYDMTNQEFIKTIDAVSSAQQKAGSSISSFAKQQSQAVSNLTNQINQLNRAANDQNASRPISNSENLSSIENAYNDIIIAIRKMGTASTDTFVEEQNNVKTLISNFKSLVKELRNAENVSTKMKGTDLSSGLSIAKNDLEKFKADAKDFPQIANTINELDKAIRNVGDTSSLNKFNDQLRVARSELAKIKSETNAANRSEKVGINVSGIKSSITDLQRISPEIDKFETEINGAKVSIESLLTDLSKVNTQSDFSVVNSKWKAFVNAAKAAGIAIDETSTKFNSLTNKANKIQLTYETGGYDAKVESLIAKTNQWIDSNGNARISTESLKAALENLSKAYLAVTSNGGNTEANQQKLIETEELLDREIKKVTNDVTQMNASFAKSSAIDSLRQKYQKFMDLNGKAMKTPLATTLKAGFNELDSGAQITTTRLRELEQELIRVENVARQAGKLGKTPFQTIREGMSSFSYWTSSTFLVMKTFQSIKSGISTVRDLDTALVDLRKTAQMSASQLEDFYYASNDVAKQMGVTTEQILEQAAAWSRLGYSTAEQATQMAKYSSMFQMISPGMDLDSATDGLVSVMKAFEIGANDVSDVVDGIMSKVNIIGNNKALNNSDIIEFLTRSSSAMASANNSLEETIALGESAVEITRDAASVGQALKTVSMRIRSYDEETESYSEDLENLKGEIASLTKTASTPGGISLFTDESKQTYKSTYEILKEISEIWDELSDKNQARLLETLAGKRQGQIVSAIISNFDSARESMELMANSAGNAEAEMSVAMDSVAYKANITKETFTGIAQNLFQREDMKNVLDFFNGIINILDKLTDKLGLFGTAGLGMGLFSGLKNVGKTCKCAVL